MSKSLPSDPLRPHTFLTLDALRGIAAFSILILHLRGDLGHPFFAHAYLSVDFFFMLSGFVLSYAYQQRLDNGLSTLAFIKVRLIRLYPLYIAGTLAGFIYACTTFLHTGKPGVSGYLFRLLEAVFFLPAIPPHNFPGIEAFPYNTFAWSLCYELLANILHASLLRRRSTPTLLVAAAAAGVPLCVMTLQIGTGGLGTLTQEMHFAIPRVIFSYIIGMLLFRLWSHHRDRQSISPFWAVLLLLLTVSVPEIRHYNGIFDVIMLLSVLPILILLGSFSQPSGLARPIASMLGVLSYGIYILSMPTITYGTYILNHLVKRSPETRTPWFGLALITLVTFTAWLGDALYDVPVRRWLRNHVAN